MGKVIGIDLGSTNSAVAVIEGGKPVAIANSEGNRTTPSIICLKDGERIVGDAAKRKMVTTPKETVTIIKRFMGATYDESKEAIKHVLYNVVSENVNGVAMPYVEIEGRKYSAEELSAMIIQKMKKTAEDYLGEEVKDAIITVPAYFGDSARAATKKAGEICGLTVHRVIAEPTAALLASNIDLQKSGKYLVTDFGGKTNVTASALAA